MPIRRKKTPRRRRTPKKRTPKRTARRSDFKLNIGSRAQVWHGTAYQTSGGLKKPDLRKNKWGRIVSKRASEAARNRFKYVKDIFEKNRIVQ